MKNTIQKSLLIGILMLICTVTSFAQLKVSSNMNSHPDPYLSHWPDIKNTVIVTVTNSGKKTVPAKFRCIVNFNGSLVANTKDPNMQTLQIAPGVTLFFAEQLVPFENVNVVGGADKRAATTGMLEAGEYEFCVSLIDPQTSAQLTPPVCKNFTLVSYQAPVLLQPMNATSLGKSNRATFRWTAVSPMPSTPAHYHILVFEVLKGQTPVTAFRVNRQIVDVNGITATQFLWPSDIDLPKEGMQYVWSVQATDDQGNTIGEPNGYAEPFTFFACCQGDTSGNDGKQSANTQNGDSVKTLDITLLSPQGENRQGSLTPAFEWKTNSKIEGSSFTITLKEVPKDGDAGSGKIIFERKGIVENSLSFPADVSPLDSTKAYLWEVTSIGKNGNVLGSSLKSPFWWWNWCLLFPYPQTQNICLGTALTLNGFAFMSSTGNFDWWLTHDSPSAATQSGTQSSPIINVIPSPQPTAPAVYQYSLKVTRGTCSKTINFIVNVYPKILTSPTFSQNPICSGDEGFLSIAVDPPSSPVNWSYFDNPPGVLPPIPTIGTTAYSGISLNTNPIIPLTCACPPGKVTRTYRAMLDLSYWGLPPYLPTAPPTACPNTMDLSIPVYCHTDVGSIALSVDAVDPGHLIEPGNKICSWAHVNPVIANYPIKLDLIWTPGCGNITSWAVTGGTLNPGGSSTNPSQTWTIPAPGTPGTNTYTVTVMVQNGPFTSGLCGPQPVQLKITVVDPPAPPIFTVIDIDGKPVSGISCPFSVCPRADATFAISPCIPGLIYQWSYLPVLTCASGPDPCPDKNAAWIPVSGGSSAGTGCNQNTNETGPMFSNWKHVWWRVTAQDPLGICDPVSSACCEININQPPCPPDIKDGPYQKCAGESVKLKATPGTGPCCGKVLCYQWYWYGDGSKVGPCLTNLNTPFSVTKPGSYVLVAEGLCESTPSESVLVEDIQVGVTITGCECCPQKDEQVKLTAVGFTTCKKGGTGTYSWTGTGIVGSISGASITTPNLQVGTSTYCVTYTDPCGCATATDCCIMNVCN